MDLKLYQTIHKASKFPELILKGWLAPVFFGSLVWSILKSRNSRENTTCWEREPGTTQGLLCGLPSPPHVTQWCPEKLFHINEVYAWPWQFIERSWGMIQPHKWIFQINSITFQFFSVFISTNFYFIKCIKIRHVYGLNISDAEKLIIKMPSPLFSVPHSQEVASFNPLISFYFCLYCYFLISYF